MVRRTDKGFRDYINSIGFKVLLPVGFVMLIATLSNLYRQGGWPWVYTQVMDPFFWITPVAAFLVMSAIISKVIIFPLKKFESHLRALTKHNTFVPFKYKAHDELGYVTETFNKLRKEVVGQLDKRTLHLSILDTFMTASSGIFEVETLMKEFFRILSLGINFNVGAYMINKNNLSESSIFTSTSLLNRKRVELVKDRLLKSAKGLNPIFLRVESRDINVVVLKELDLRDKHWKGEKIYSIEIPITCFSKNIGVISLISTQKEAPIFDRNVIDPMVQHATMVLERLLLNIRARDKRLENILYSMNDGIYIVDEHSHMATMNPKGKELLTALCDHGECELSFYGFNNICKNSDNCAFTRILTSLKDKVAFDDCKYIQEEVELNNKVFNLSITPIASVAPDASKDSVPQGGYVIIARDVTKEKLMQKQLLLSSKLAALGEMAAGIAHEVNNPLQMMMGNAELLGFSLGDTKVKDLEKVEKFKAGILRIKSIVRNLLIFAREQTTESETVDLNATLVRTVDMLKEQLKLLSVNVELELDSRSLFVQCNKNLLQQVFLNLLNNSRDAIEGSGVGSRIHIRTTLMNSSEVVLEFSDDGPGIKKEILDDIFDPFFTTKEVGKGTGLGLSLSKRIIEGMGGTISVSSPKGGGTAFYISLVSIGQGIDADEDKEKESVNAKRIDYASIKTKRVILIDDELSVAETVKEIIGPNVSELDISNDGCSALNMIKDGDYDVILLDIKMPKMDGMELFRKIKECKPYMAERIIFLTGDTESEKTKAFLTLTNCQYLSKPFETNDLVRLMSD